MSLCLRDMLITNGPNGQTDGPTDECEFIGHRFVKPVNNNCSWNIHKIVRHFTLREQRQCKKISNLEGVYMMSFRPKRGGNGRLASIEIGQFIYMRPGVSAEPSSSVLMAEALLFVSGVAAM